VGKIVKANKNHIVVDHGEKQSELGKYKYVRFVLELTYRLVGNNYVDSKLRYNGGGITGVQQIVVTNSDRSDGEAEKCAEVCDQVL
jgi:hypothetical protein